MTGLLNGLGLIAIFTVSGCATYHSLPLTPDAVHARLQPPEMAELRILASNIKHPVLHPVELKPNEGLSPDGAAVLAVMLNPSLRAIRDQRGVAVAQLLDAGLLPDPELDVSTGNDTTAYGLGLNWDVVSLVSRASRKSEAKAHKEAVDIDIAWQEWQTAQAARIAVYQLVSLQAQIALAEESCHRLAQNVMQIQKAVTDGFMTNNTLNAAQFDSHQANEELLDLKKKTDQQYLQLERLLGLPTGTKIILKKDIDLPSLVELPPETELIDGLEQRRPDLLALRRGYDSQEAAVRTTVMEQFPKISIGPTLSRDSDNKKAAGFGLNIELPIFNQNQGKIAREQMTRQRLFDEYANRVFEARSDIEMIASGIHFTNEQVVAAQEVESDLERLVENYRTALTDGRVDALTYSRAWSDLVRAKIKVISIKGQLAQAVAALQLASGLYEIPKPGTLPSISPTEPEEKVFP